MPSPLKSNRGQIAVFLVLLFQVLFVFFAMSMNIGLVVYDKINLQNSADLSAYYAAQKQAELLNQIAHINYQMRQAYKLLTFRFRVIGSVSIGVGPEARLAPHPIRVGPDFGKEGQAFFENPPGRYVPAVCIGSSLWKEYQITEQNATVSLCQNLDQFSAVPPSGGSDPFGFTSGLNAFLDRVRGEIEEKCKVVGVLNWQLAASWFYAYVHEATERRKMIDAIADNMSRPAAEMTDFTGQSVAVGAQNTFKKNLTGPQQDSMSFKLINSLSSDVPGPCSERAYWLPPIDLKPAVAYVSMIWGGFTCTTRVVTNRGNSPPSDYIGMVGGRNNGVLKSVWDTGAAVPYGVEKNPWCMPYMGVSVTTQPRKIFSPFANPPVLKAEAYAKPFGGRIGPWYSNQWSSGSKNSSGTTNVDPLLPRRSIDGAASAGSPEKDIVNHSKYPGDINGMNSAYALGVMKDFFMPLTGGNPIAMAPVFALAHYNHVGNPSDFEGSADSLARSNGTTTPSGDLVRQMEVAAIIPDLFDITYYSVEAQYSHNFHNTNNPNFSSFVQPYYPDIGSSGRNAYGVEMQMRISKNVFKAAYPFYLVAQPDNLLTGWTQNKAVNYEFPTAHFGKCLQRRDGEMETTPGPGGCPHGGRSGYSVKVVSQSYLRKVSADLGGPGNSGPILNPPPDSASP